MKSGACVALISTADQISVVILSVSVWRIILFEELIDVYLIDELRLLT